MAVIMDHDWPHWYPCGATTIADYCAFVPITAEVTGNTLAEYPNIAASAYAHEMPTVAGVTSLPPSHSAAASRLIIDGWPSGRRLQQTPRQEKHHECHSTREVRPRGIRTRRLRLALARYVPAIFGAQVRQR